MQANLKDPYAALAVDWVKAKGGERVIPVPGELRWLIARKDGWVIAEVLEE